MWEKIKKFVAREAFALFLAVGLVAGQVPAYAGGLPQVPSSPTFSEPSQIVATLNALIAQLNGQPAGSGGYAALPNGVPSLGSFCAGSSATLSITCNGFGPSGGGTRGTLTFTAGVTGLATGAVLTVTVTDNSITATMICQAWWASAFTAGSAMTVATVVATANTLTIIVVNAGTTTNAVATGTMGFNCVT